MAAYLEILASEGVRLVKLDAGRVTVGQSDANDVVIADRKVSRIHAIVELLGGGWCVRDVGSRNGTFLNGERIAGERLLRSGDELRLGETALRFRADAVAPTATVTEAADPAPEITRREKDVLIALCRPVLNGTLLTQPATVREMSQELFLTPSAVKKHLQRLYDKFGVAEDTGSRRTALAGIAIKRGAVKVADLGD